MLQEPLKSGDLGPALVLIDPGEFLMGSPSNELGRSEDEGPQRQSAVKKPFYMGRTEVTVEAFSDFVSVTNFEPDSVTNGCYVWREGKPDIERDASWIGLPGYDTGSHYPAVCVSWRDAVRYVRWLSEQTGATYRLPSELEWEYAVRAGAQSARYWGEEPDVACQYANVADLAFQNRYKTLSRDIHYCDD